MQLVSKKKHAFAHPSNTNGLFKELSFKCFNVYIGLSTEIWFKKLFCYKGNFK